ncbi:hypothetical protein AVEN_234879-1 [Araneus ventricosus]|uniref:Uncharacterized protein n=1 Tax=Araneus ventricosus TaxID=182803 RepID=A0A4Y2MN50_ARAVE|nr:hypothetical protein AVEN_234879-1 [Araneus ventricosus]
MESRKPMILYFQSLDCHSGTPKNALPWNVSSGVSVINIIFIDWRTILHQYQLIVFLQAAGNISETIESKANLTIFGEKHLLQKELSLKIDLSIPNQVNTFLFTSFQLVGKIHSVEVSQLPSNSDANEAVVKAIEVNYLHPEVRKVSENKYCRASSVQEQKLKQNTEFSSIHCHHYQEYS